MKITLNKAKYGDVILFYPTSWYGRLISYFDGSPYSHIATYLESRDGYHWMLESTVNKNGFVISKIREDWDNFDVYDMKLYRKYLRSSREMMDLVDERPYDISRLLEIFLHYVLKLDLNVSNAQRLICAEAVNLQFSYKLVDNNQSPRTIWEKIR